MQRVPLEPILHGRAVVVHAVPVVSAGSTGRCRVVRLDLTAPRSYSECIAKLAT